MSGKIRVELNNEGVRELLRSAEMEAICKQQAQAIKDRVGDGYLVTTYTGRNRVNASVYAVTDQAKRDNLKNNTLLKAVK